MGMIQLKNTREHDISINTTDSAGTPVRATIPGARIVDDKIIPGVGEIDQDMLEQAADQSETVRAYFEKGYLQLPEKSTAVPVPEVTREVPTKAVKHSAKK